MAFTQRLVYETLRSADTASATAYLVLGTPLLHAASIVKMVNNSNKTLLISVDGTNDHDVCPNNSFWLYDSTSNSPHANAIFIAQGTQFFVKTSDGAAGTGLVYLAVQYVVQV